MVANTDMQIYLITKWILLDRVTLCLTTSSLFVFVYVQRGLLKTHILQLIQEDKLFFFFLVCFPEYFF